MAYDCEITRIYNSVRSKIEWVIRDVKCFAILKNEYCGFNCTDLELKFHFICRLVNFKKTVNKNFIKQKFCVDKKQITRISAETLATFFLGFPTHQRLTLEPSTSF